jgi:hypothetical protein
MATIRFRISEATPRVRVADPDGAGRLVDVELTREGDFGVAELPNLRLWQLVLVEG